MKDSSKQDLFNVFDELSSVGNVDENLRSVGYEPEMVVKNGMERLRQIQKRADYRSRLVTKVIEALGKTVDETVLKNMSSLRDLLPRLSGGQLTQVYAKLNETDTDLNQEYIDELFENKEFTQFLKDSRSKLNK